MEKNPKSVVKWLIPMATSATCHFITKGTPGGTLPPGGYNRIFHQPKRGLMDSRPPTRRHQQTEAVMKTRNRGFTGSLCPMVRKMKLRISCIPVSSKQTYSCPTVEPVQACTGEIRRPLDAVVFAKHGSALKTETPASQQEPNEL